MGEQFARLFIDRSSEPRETRTRVLARGLWLKTARCGTDVVRSPQPWCPPALGAWLQARLLSGAERFGGYLPVPPMRTVIGSDGQILLQPYLADATPLRQLTAVQLADPLVLHSLQQFWRAVAHGWQRIGWLPDIGGRVFLPWELYRPLQTDNVLIDGTGACWLVDVGATATFHSARSPVGRLHATLMLRAIRQCARRLDDSRQERVP